jgi:L-asparaginase
VKKRVYIAYTGGTIGMRKTPQGYAPAPGFLGEQMSAMPELRAEPMPEYTIHEYAPLLDSSNMMPSDWVTIAEDIARNYDAYDGFIVVHGTDTMAYTASALPFMLQGLRKPVIITGSQIPLCEVRNDARSNLITALLIAANYSIPEVCLFFGSRLLRGCRAVKVSADAFDAFDSPNYPPLGEIGIDIEIDWDLVIQPPETAEFTVHGLERPVVAALRLFPGISGEIVRNMLQPPLQGLVLEAFGVGNAPDRNRELLEAIRDATGRGVVIVDTTQCLEGSVDLDDYATGSALATAGVISGRDMTAEAALTKLFYLFSRKLPSSEVSRLMQVNLRGEMSDEP